jgi:hypothetical protein
VWRLMSRAILIWTVAICHGCAGKPLDPISAETLIGRWRAVTKGDADEGNETRDARGPTGETIVFRYEFKADHTFEMSSQIKGGLQTRLVPQFAGKHVVGGKWSVVEVKGDTLTIEFPDPRFTGAGIPAPRMKAVFTTKDRCLLDADGEDAMVLTRLP